jgi:hypothetical protein
MCEAQQTARPDRHLRPSSHGSLRRIAAAYNVIYRRNVYVNIIEEETMNFKGTIIIKQEEEWFVATCFENNIEHLRERQLMNRSQI